MAKETFSSLIDLFKTSSSTTVASLVCDVCGNKLSVFRKKKPCAECRRQFCSQCLQRCLDRALRCKNCSVMTMRPPLRSALLDLRVKDLQHYLNQHNVSTRGCLEKEDLVNVLLRYASTPVNAPSKSSSDSSGRSQIDSSSSNRAASSSQHGLSPQSPDAASPPTRPSAQSSSGPGDSDSSSDTSFEMIQRPSSDENVTSVHSSASSSSTSSITNHGQSTMSAFSSSAGISGEAVVSSESAEAVVSGVLSTDTCMRSAATARSGTATATLDMTTTSEVGATTVNRTGTSAPSEVPRGSSIPSSDALEAPTQSTVLQTNSSSNSPNLLRDTMASISSESDFEALSVKQLKDILLRHRVNYHGCCEKAELVDRAKRLYRDYCSSRADLEKLDIDALCKICMDAPVECVMLECGHMATCTDCGRQLSECPICRQFVVRIVRTFKA